MLWTIFIESNAGEVLATYKADGSITGKVIVNFETTLSSYCLKQLDAQYLAWFNTINTYMNERLCEILRPFLSSIYSGDWDYEEDEYEFFTHRHPEFALEFTEEKFKQTIKDIKNKWVVIEDVLSAIEKLISGFKNTKLEATYWYDPVDTIEEFEAVYNTLRIFIDRGAEKVRIEKVRIM